MSAESVTTLTKFFELVGSGEMTTALELMSPQCVVSEAPGLPFGGDYVGHEGFVNLFATIARDFEMNINTWTISDIVGGDVVIADFAMTLQSHVTGESLDMRTIEFYHFTDGLISAIDVFYKDSKAVADLAAGVSKGHVGATG